MRPRRMRGSRRVVVLAGVLALLGIYASQRPVSSGNLNPKVEISPPLPSGGNHAVPLYGDEDAVKRMVGESSTSGSVSPRPSVDRDEAGARRGRRDAPTGPAGSSHANHESCGPDGPEILHNSIVLSADFLAENAERIVVGRVVDAVARWNEDRTVIYTYYTLEVAETLKGEVGPRVQVRVIGGKIPGETLYLRVSHQPEFEIGDEGIVFLDDDPHLWTGVVGNQQGFLPFESSSSGRRVIRDGFNRPVYGLTPENRFIVEVDDSRRPMSDREAIARIRGFVDPSKTESRSSMSQVMEKR